MVGMGPELPDSKRSHSGVTGHSPSRVGQALHLDGSVLWVLGKLTCGLNSQAPESQSLKSGLSELESPH